MLRTRLNQKPSDPSSTPTNASDGSPESSEPCLDLNPRPLTAMEAMRVAVVEDVTGDADDLSRLKSMGVCVGRRLQLVKGGDPLVLRVLGSRIGVSRRLAEQVSVRPCLLSGD